MNYLNCLIHFYLNSKILFLDQNLNQLPFMASTKEKFQSLNLKFQDDLKVPLFIAAHKVLFQG